MVNGMLAVFFYHFANLLCPVYLGTGHEEENTQTCVNVELREYATSEDFKAAYSDYILPSVFVFV